MSNMEEQLGKGYQQMMIGLIIFIAGAIWGGMVATDGMVAEDIYWPAVMMLSGAMITLLGTTFGTDHEDDRSNDLGDAIIELTDRINRLVGASDDSSDESE
ncbi:MAG: hypothetical protein CMB25_04530 [Euryarchaeota archaeon]|nr:hypothetical protein [Euryarchaeota archaeon]|tara:strand:+ start:4286 stop:4588 length:303 start_codon:yes stop_codon:yes gene_type:complete